MPAALLDQLLDTACLAPSVGLSQPWRFVTVDEPARRAAVRENFSRCNAAALAGQADRAATYARLKLAGLDEAPCQLAVFAVPDPAQGHGLGRRTMPETTVYSTVIAVHTLWLAARAAGLGLGWVSILDPAEVSAALDVPAEWILHRVFLPRHAVRPRSCTPELESAGWEHRRRAEAVRLRR